MKQKGINKIIKKLIFLNLLFIGVHLLAQNKINKVLKSNANLVFIEFDLIDNLELINSDLNIISVSSNNDFGGSSNFILEEDNGVIFIENKLINQKEVILLDKECVTQPNYSSYTISIPKGKKIDVNIGEGNFKSKNLDGDLNLNVEKGIVYINEFRGKLKININVGNVYCNIKNTVVNASTNLGFIKTKIPLKNDKELKSVIGKPKNELNIHALKANIFIEKINVKS